MNTVAKFVNQETGKSLTIVVSESKAEMYREVSIKGMEIGKTSFMKLVGGKVSEACGWTVQFAPETIEEIAADSSLQELVEVLAKIGVETNTKVAKTEQYVTFKVKEGRIQANPTKGGKYSLMFFPRKGFGPDEITKFSVAEVKSQYTRLEPMTANSIALELI